MSTSRIWQKVLASVVNCTLVLLVSAPFYPVLGAERWKIATIAIFFLYNICCRKRCLGMRLVGTYIDPPTSILYAALYSCGFATFFYSVFWPTDLLLANGVVQVGSLAMTGNTLHGNLTGSGTLTEEQYLERCKQRARDDVAKGKLHEAVAGICADLGKYPNLRPAPEIVYAGMLAIPKGERAVLDYIDGFK